MNESPTVTSILSDRERRKARYIKPKVRAINESDSRQSPAFLIGAARKFTLWGRHVVPFHKNLREKTYFSERGGIAILTQIHGSGTRDYPIRRGHPVVVQPNTWHCLRFFPKSKYYRLCRLTVHFSGQSKSDVTWQDGARDGDDHLLKNEHLKHRGHPKKHR